MNNNAADSRYYISMDEDYYDMDAFDEATIAEMRDEMRNDFLYTSDSDIQELVNTIRKANATLKYIYKGDTSGKTAVVEFKL